jgi:hypothetical protein
MALRLGDRKKIADETWAVNKSAALVTHDLVFRMDDLRTKPRSVESYADNLGSKMLDDAYFDLLKKSKVPIITSKAYPEYPMSMEYPLHAVINHLGFDYFTTTPAYAIAFAIHIGVEVIRLYGCDYTYPDADMNEKGRGAVEFWCGYAMAKGITVRPCARSTLLCQNEPDAKLYGFTGLEVRRTDTTPSAFYIGKKRKPRESARKRA